MACLGTGGAGRGCEGVKVDYAPETPGDGPMVEPRRFTSVRRMSRLASRVDSRSAAIAPLSSAGRTARWTTQRRFLRRPPPGGAGSPCSRSPIYVFTIPILAFTMEPIPVFTLRRSRRSRSTDPSVHLDHPHQYRRSPLGAAAAQRRPDRGSQYVIRT